MGGFHDDIEPTREILDPSKYSAHLDTAIRELFLLRTNAGFPASNEVVAAMERVEGVLAKKACLRNRPMQIGNLRLSAASRKGL